jgi:hypothetical protein
MLSHCSRVNLASGLTLFELGSKRLVARFTAELFYQDRVLRQSLAKVCEVAFLAGGFG